MTIRDSESRPFTGLCTEYRSNGTSQWVLPLNGSYHSYHHQGDDTPFYHIRAASGEFVLQQPVNSFTKREVNFSCEAGWSLSAPGGYSAYHHEGSWAQGHGVPLDQSSHPRVQDCIQRASEDLAVIAAAAALKPDTNLLTFALEDVRELPKLIFGTAQLLRSTLKRGVSRAYDFADKRGNRFKYNRPVTSKDLAGAFLSVDFGWRPLIHSLKDIHQRLVAIDERLYSKSYIRSRCASGAVATDSFTITTPYAQNEWAGNYLTSVDVEVSPRGCARLGFDRPPSFDMDPFATAWELMPWSWMIDYVFKVGERIQALDALSAATTRTLWSGLQVKCRTHIAWDGYVRAPFTGYYDHSSTFEVVQTTRRPRGINVLLTPDLASPSLWQAMHAFAAASQLPKQSIRLL